MAFAASLQKIVVSKKQQLVERSEVAAKWTSYESTMLNEAVKLFRQRCIREANNRRSQLNCSFEVISREIEGFPRHCVKDQTYVVASWGADVTPEAWFYATHGSSSTWSPGAPVLFAEMLEGMMPKFLERLKPLGFEKCNREAGTWKVGVTWSVLNGETNGNGGDKTFADELSEIVAHKGQEDSKKQEIAAEWKKYEVGLLEQAEELFKGRCTREAEQQRCEVTVSFEVLSREITDFPKRVIRDSNYFVESWTEGVTAECWFYATHGTNATFNEAEPVLFAEVLECMMPKFIERLRALGFKRCSREPGTWKVSVAWEEPEAPAKRAKIT